MPTAMHNAANWSEIGQIEIIDRLAEIGRVLQLPDAEILLASTNVHELNAFCQRYKQSSKWVVFGCLDEMIADRYSPRRVRAPSTDTKPPASPVLSNHPPSTITVKR